MRKKTTNIFGKIIASIIATVLVIVAAVSTYCLFDKDFRKQVEQKLHIEQSDNSSDLTSENQTEIIELEEQLKEQQQENQDIKDENSNLKTEISENQAEIAELENQIISKQNALNRVNAELETALAENSENQEVIETLQAEKNELESDIETLQAEKTVLEDNVSDLQALIQQSYFKVDFLVDGENYKTDYVKYNNLLTEPEEPTKNNSAFYGWLCGSELIDFTTFKVTSNITLNAKFTVFQTFTATNLKTDIPNLYNAKTGNTLSKSNMTSIKFLNKQSSGFSYLGAIENLSIYYSGYDIEIVCPGIIYAPESCQGFFEQYTALKTLDFANFDTSNVTDMSGMFYACMALETLNVSNFNTSNVTEMSYLFSYCKSIKQLDIRNFNTSNVISMANMFQKCLVLETLHFDFNTANVETMEYMFSECEKLTTSTALHCDKFNLSKVKNMMYMFNECKNITDICFTNTTTSNLKCTDNMFFGCEKLQFIDITAFDTSKVDSMKLMFGNCSVLDTIYVSDLWSTVSLVFTNSSQDMFYGCYSLPNFNEDVVDKTNAHTGTGGYLTHI